MKRNIFIIKNNFKYFIINIIKTLFLLEEVYSVLERPTKHNNERRRGEGEINAISIPN